MQAPAYSGSEYYNYKKSFILLPLVDSNYNFIFAEIESGKIWEICEEGIFRKSQL